MKSANDFTNDNVKKTGLHGFVDDFSVDYNAFNKFHINIHRTLMVKNNIK